MYVIGHLEQIRLLLLISGKNFNTLGEFTKWNEEEENYASLLLDSNNITTLFGFRNRENIDNHICKEGEGNY